MSEAAEVTESAHPMDALITDLRALRDRAGAPSYAAITQRIVTRRREAGLGEGAAYLNRSTVYDAFQLGRRRLNPALVVEIVLALGGKEADSDGWKHRCVQARNPAPVPVPADENAKAPSVAEPALRSTYISPAVLPLSLAACLALNFAGGWFVMVMRLPLYLDMVGTAIASVVLGPWWGALVGLCTNGTETAYDGTAALPFSIVNVAGALMWGYGVRRLGLGRSVSRFFALNVFVALLCSAIAVPILVLRFRGITANATSLQTLALASAYHSLLAGAWSANTLTSLADKLITGVGVLTVTSLVPSAMTSRLPESWGMGSGSGGYASRTTLPQTVET